MTDKSLLMEEIERAEGGSISLDCNMHAVVLGGYCEDIDSSGAHVVIDGQLHGISLRAVPNYSVSLDAKLPWENIVKVEKRVGGWLAWQEREDGEDFKAVAATEPLARRLAALKGMPASLEAREIEK